MHELAIHAEIEEEIFYPAAKTKADKEGKSLVAEAVEEHHVVKGLISELQAMPAVNEQFEARLTALIDNVEHHIGEEEEEMLPDAKQTLGKEIESFVDRMMARKDELLVASR
jgi:hemerythrin-like domain-containing protein